MNKSNLVDSVAANTGLTKKQADAAISAAFAAIANALKENDKVQLIGFGTFKVKERAERTGINPRTKAEIKIAASKIPAFVPGKALKDSIN